MVPLLPPPATPTGCRHFCASINCHRPRKNLQKPSETIQLIIKTYSEPIRVTSAASRALPVAPRDDRPEILKLCGLAQVWPPPAPPSRFCRFCASINRHRPREILQKRSETIQLAIQKYSEPVRGASAATGARPVTPRDDHPEILELRGSARGLATPGKHSKNSF